MTALTRVADDLLAGPVLAEAMADARDVAALDLTGPAAVRPFVIRGLVDAGRTVLAVTATAREAEDLVTELVDLVDPARIAYYPSWETLPHERLSPRSDTVGRRLAVLRRLRHPGTDATNGPLSVVVAPIRSLLQPQVKGLADLEPVELVPGQTVALEDVVRGLADAAYTRVDMVEKRGEFAVRGGIVDVFPPTEEHPLRVEFWGDDVEEIRAFAVADQRTMGAVERLWAPPCRELLLTDEVRRRAAELGRAHPQLLELTDKIAAGIAVEGMESLAPALVDEMELLVDLVPEATTVLVLDPERARTRAHDLVATSEEFLGASWAAAAGGGQSPIDLSTASYREVADVREHALDRRLAWWTVSPFGIETDDTPGVDLDVVVGAVSSRGLTAQPAEAYRGDLERAITDVRGWLADGYRVTVVHPGHGPAERMVEVLGEHDVPAGLDADGQGVVTVTTGCLTQGVVDPAVRVALITGEDLSGQKASTRDMRKMPARRKKQIDPLELKAGDHVVHEQHGVGRFVEMMQREMAGATREYLVLEYGASKRGAPPDRLFVPADTLDQVTRYVGGEQPSLDRLGGGDWTKRKNRARKAVREIAAELIKLYAARQATQGHAFGPDTPWQRELEDAFPFNETPDQLSTVDEVKADMRRTVPMDRLVCGDVGYGKTEIAVRAAFKAVQDGKQVAVLVPTTLLVTQHLSTFTERMSGFPVVLKGLSRFQTDKEASTVIDELATGAVDIVVGTHRLLNPDIRMKDLGLIIVDEEQRFGVEHKEQMKRLRTSVDVLSMSATPDPAHPRDGGHRHPGDVDDHHPSRGAAPGADLRGRLRGPSDRRRGTPRAAARGPGLLHPQPGQLDREGRRPHPRARARGPGGHGARPDGGAPARAGDARLLGEALRRARLHDHRGVGPRRVQRQHDDHRAVRHPRPVPAAPAARSRRPVPGAGLRLLPLPGREAADRDRPRAAGHPGPALRPRRRHGDRDEGPRDPRRGQPARRRAVRPHRRRRLRPLRPARRRGGRGLQGRTPSPRSTRSASSCRSTPTCRTTTSPASGCASRSTSAWPRCAPTRTSTGCARSSSTGTATRPRSCESLLVVARFRARARQAGIGEVTIAGKYVRFAPVDLPESRVVRLQPALSESDRQGAGQHDPGAASADRGRRGQADRRHRPA